MDIRINIEVNTRRAKRGFDETEKGAKKARRSTDALAASLSRLRRIAGFLGFGVLISSLTDYADALTDIQNRLRFVVGATGDLAGTTAKLKEIADDTRSSFQGTAELYQRVALAAKNLGRDQSKLFDVVKSVNQAIILSGASAKEANNGLIQLSQGIAANRLGGDELRSVLEQLPVVADTIARQLGITRGQLRAFGEQGKITADVVLDAFENSAERLTDDFGATLPTIGQSLQVLKNNVIDFLGELNRGTGVFSLIAAGVASLAKNIKVVGAALALAFARPVFLAIQNEFIRLQAVANASLKATVRSLLTVRGALTGISSAAAIAALSYRNDIKLIEDSTADLEDLVAVTFDKAGKNIRDFASLAQYELSQAVGAVDWTPVETSFRDLSLFLATGFDGIVNSSRGLVAEIVNAFQIGFKEIVRFVSNFTNSVAASFDAIGASAKLIVDSVSASIGLLNAALEQSFKGEFEAANDLVDQAKVTLSGGFAVAGKAAANAYRTSFEDRMRQTDAGLDVFIGETSRVGELLASAIGDEATTLFADGVGQLFADAIARADGEVLEAADAIGRAQRRAAEDTAALAEAQNTALFSSDELTRKYRQQTDALIAQIKYGEDAAEVTKALAEAQNRLTKRTPGAELDEGTKAAIETQVRYNEQLKRVAELTQEGSGSFRRMAADQEALRVALNNGVITLTQYQAALVRLREETGGENSFAAGLDEGLARVRERVFDLTTSTSESVQNLAGATEDFLAGSITAAASYFATMLTEGKASFADFKEVVTGLFRDLISAMIQELARLMAQRAMMQLFGAFAGAGGGLAEGFTGASNAFNPATSSPTGLSSAFPGARAIGGTVMGNKPYMVGERGPELFFPGRTGSIATNAQSMKMMEKAMGGNGGGTTVVQAPAPQVNVNPQIVLDPSQVVNQGLNDDMIVQAISRNSSQVRSITGGAS